MPMAWGFPVQAPAAVRYAVAQIFSPPPLRLVSSRGAAASREGEKNMHGFSLRAMAMAAGICLTAACSEQALECEKADCVADQQYKDTTIDSVMMFPNAFGWNVKNPRFDPPPAKARGVLFEKAYLEVREDGVLWDARQIDAILQKIDALAAEKRPVFVFAFAHGWHHNADTHDRPIDPPNPNYKVVADEPTGLGFNAIKFDYLMARFADQVRRQFELNGDDNAPAMLGIYIGWRGKSTYDFVSNAINVRNRAEAADRIGLRTGADSLRAALGSIAQKVDGTGAASRMIVSGHSLGGRMMSQMFLPEIAGGTPYPLGEKALIVAIEPAISAACYDGVFRDRTAKRDEHMIPGFIAITSAQDDAVVQGFRFGHLLPRLNPWMCNDSSPASHSAIGVYPPYVTHVWDFTGPTDVNLPKAPCKRPTLSLDRNWMSARQSQ